MAKKELNVRELIHRPSFKERLFFFFSGAAISVPFPIVIDSLANQYLAALTTHFYASLITVAIIAPFFEEFAKAYPLFYRHGETERSLFTLGFLTGLGFGLVEFLLYVFVLHTSVFVRLPALLFHATNTSIVAYGITKNKTFWFYLLAVGLHSLNNFSAEFGSFWIAGAIIATLASYIISWYLNHRSVEKILDRFIQV